MNSCCSQYSLCNWNLSVFVLLVYLKLLYFQNSYNFSLINFKWFFKYTYKDKMKFKLERRFVRDISIKKEDSSKEKSYKKNI